MRTDAEILARIEAVAKRDVFGFERSDLVGFLSFEAAQPFLEAICTKADWAEVFRNPSPYSIRSIILEYMPFAWEKANECRGVSAMRSMCHYSAWLWIAEVDLGNLYDYRYYGKDNLVKICNHFGWDSTLWDDGHRVNAG